MNRLFSRFSASAVLTACLLVPTGALAQTGSIAGTVTDETGGVLPGVTVEARSPALIEGVRSTVSDGSGLYSIEALRPGTYSVTFTLPGFSTFVRDGIELSSGFTANVDGQMTVGSIEETVTVSGAAPLIDVQNVVSQENLSRDQLDTLPTGKEYWGYAALTPGMTTNIAGGGHDVGGSMSGAWGHVAIHGSAAGDGEVSWDGMTFNNNVAGGGGGSAKEYFVNQAAVQEVVVATASMDAEQPYGGVGVNMIPKEGGNEFSTYVNISGANGDWMAKNANDELIARGVNPLAKNRKIWDYGVGVGGPIVEDRVWFYTAHRWWGSQNFQPNSTVNLTPHSPRYTADPSNPSWTDFYNRDNSLRLTVQASERHKLTLMQSHQQNCACHFWTHYGLVDSFASVDYTYWPINLTQATWTFPASNRLLFEAGGSFLRNMSNPRRQDTMLPTDVAHVTFVPFFNWNANGFNVCNECLYGNEHDFPNYVFRGSVSYVTGTHNLKIGFSTKNAEQRIGLAELNNPLRFEFFTPTIPFQVTQYGTPRSSLQVSNDLGIYASDQWTIDKFTINLGIRYDRVNAYVPAQSHPGELAELFYGANATRFTPAFGPIDRIDDVPNYNDIVPRLGIAYDLRGDGRTAIKAAFGKYVQPVATRFADDANPMNAIQISSSRSWNDFSGPGAGNFVPDCDFDNFAANGECGAIQDPDFGTPNITRTFDPNMITGWGKRAYQWQTQVGIQHEITDGWSVEVGYYRTSYGNFAVVDNLNIGPEDFTEFSITAPNDPRLGDFSGQQLGGLYYITPEGLARGRNEIVMLNGDVPGGDIMSQVFNGVDVNFNGRFDNGIVLGGGLSTGSQSANDCLVIDDPTQGRPGYCDVSEPWSAGTQFKMNGAVPLPYDFQFSFVFQNIAGFPWESIYQAGANPTENAAIAAQLGYPLVAGSKAIDLFPSGDGRPLSGFGHAAGNGVSLSALNKNLTSFYEDRLTQLDLRFGKTFEMGNARVRAWFDIFNVFNEAAATNLVPNYSAPNLAYPGVASVMGGRLFKIGGQLDF